MARYNLIDLSDLTKEERMNVLEDPDFVLRETRLPDVYRMLDRSAERFMDKYHEYDIYAYEYCRHLDDFADWINNYGCKVEDDEEAKIIMYANGWELNDEGEILPIDNGDVDEYDSDKKIVFDEGGRAVLCVIE
jgi:hypothetical protein